MPEKTPKEFAHRTWNLEATSFWEIVVPFRPHPAPTPLLFGYDPLRDLPSDHLAHLIEHVVEESLKDKYRPNTPGQPAFDPRLCAKVLLYGYATGVRSSRLLQQHCQENLPYLLLTRGDAPSYRTLCSFRVNNPELIEEIWVGMFAVAKQVGMERLGRLVVDSSKFHADAGPEAVVKAAEYEPVLQELKRILKEAQDADDNEDNTPPGTTCLGMSVEPEQMRDILRRVRKQQAQKKAQEKASSAQPIADTSADTPPTAPPEIGDEPALDAPLGSAPVIVPEGEPPYPGPEPALDAPLGSAPPGLGPRMLPRIQAGIKAIEAAQQDQRQHACLTDPDARMMGEGREKKVRECHSYEVAVDNGLLVVGQSCQSGVDNPRLLPILEAAEAQEPGGIDALDADSGYYSGDTIASLVEKGMDVCIPDAHTACDLHRGEPIGTNRQKSAGSLEMTYDAVADHYTCPQGNILAYKTITPNKGQQMRVYRAKQPCTDCPLRVACGIQPQSKYRTMSVGTHSDELRAHLARFADAAHVERYRQRAPMVETVFGCLRAILGYSRWMLRGTKRVAAEASLFTAALQIRKIHMRWSQV